MVEKVNQASAAPTVEPDHLKQIRSAPLEAPSDPPEATTSPGNLADSQLKIEASSAPADGSQPGSPTTLVFKSERPKPSIPVVFDEERETIQLRMQMKSKIDLDQ